MFVLIFFTFKLTCLLLKVKVQVCCRGMNVGGTWCSGLSHFYGLIKDEYHNRWHCWHKIAVSAGRCCITCQSGWGVLWNTISTFIQIDTTSLGSRSELFFFLQNWGINKKRNVYKVDLESATMFFSCQTGIWRSRGNLSFHIFWMFPAFQKARETRVAGSVVLFLMTQLQIHTLWQKPHPFCDQMTDNFYLSFI